MFDEVQRMLAAEFDVFRINRLREGLTLQSSAVGVEVSDILASVDEPGQFFAEVDRGPGISLSNDTGSNAGFDAVNGAADGGSDRCVVVPTVHDGTTCLSPSCAGWGNADSRACTRRA